ncbi:succinate dehydrogenase cytochrome B558 [Bacillaceae bacterium]
MGSYFFQRKLHSLLGVIPVGAFLIVHLTQNYFATRGEEAYQRGVAFLESLPFLIVIETLFIFLPLLYHAVYGLYIAFQAKHNVGNFGYFRNVMFMLQRVTGIITLVFVAWHVWETRVQYALGNVDASQFYQLMVDILSNPFMLAFYVIGLLSTTFHFSNGLWSFLVHWGITIGPRSQRVATYFTMAIFVAISIIGLASIFAFANAA